ncbi:DUF4843 domain-containing protein [Sphingobacterium tabacisoli]|uniref:DUF4843 domain-containing protein n=1 Tax=Sphingobacterium tabacisoli TaxID=2044855 RepID=A0ABW5KZZ6_9SPHI|nr:DUF4843 domain-containing protein [Sphingobacterium tabacisoli]
MKIIYYLGILATGLIALSSCKKSELDSFDSPSQIYFYDTEAFTGKIRDSLMVSFARLPIGTKDTVLNLPLGYIGKVSAQDRSYRVVVDKALTTAEEGKHYVLLPEAYKVSAGSSNVKLPIKVISNPDLDKKTVQIVLKLEKNENFDIGFHALNTDLSPVEVSSYRVLLSNMLLKPDWWSTYVESLLGDFSRKKVELIYEVTGKDLDYLEETITKKYEYDPVKVIARETQIHINYKRSIGEEIKDENGMPVNMGSYVN